MKIHYTVWISLPLWFFSCASGNEPAVEKRLAALEKKQQELQDSLAQIRLDYVEPLERYQDLVMKESQTHPDTLINGYTRLMKDYPNSFWSHEAKKRVKNIEDRRDLYWNDKTGWNLDVIYVPVDATISCPGC